VYVLESFYEAPREQVAESIRSLLALESVVTVDPALLLRAVEVYETERIDFAEADLVACAESTGINRVASFDTSHDRVPVTRERGLQAAGQAQKVAPRLPVGQGELLDPAP
jgi:predicted nucleic-acid-binding protein